MNALTIRGYSLAVFAVVMGLTVAGCSHPTINVSAANAPPALGPVPVSIPGVPFYVKHGMCKRETVWVQPIHTLELDFLEGGKPIATRSITYSNSFTRNSNLKELIADLDLLAAATKNSDAARLCQTVDEAASQWKMVDLMAGAEARRPICDVAPKVHGCESLESAENLGDLLLLSNTASIVAEVDYEHPYYLNSRTPWIGNAQVDAKLNADGTLSEGSAQANDQTWAAILGSVNSLAGNIATYAGPALMGESALAPAGAESAPHAASCRPSSGWPLPSADLVYRVAASTDVYLHDHVKEDGAEDGKSLLESCRTDGKEVTGGNVTVSQQGGGPAKEDPNVIKVSGQVTMPKGGADK